VGGAPNVRWRTSSVAGWCGCRKDYGLLAGHGQKRWPGIGPRFSAPRLILYFDTSALIKLIVVEEGSELASELWGSAPSTPGNSCRDEEHEALLPKRSEMDRKATEPRFLV
jgi:hypothetical protein